MLQMDPDYLVIAVGAIGMERQKEWLQGNPALAPLKAIRQSQFLTVDGPTFTSVSHHVADAVVELAGQVYPEKLSDEP